MHGSPGKVISYFAGYDSVAHFAPCRIGANPRYRRPWGDRPGVVGHARDSDKRLQRAPQLYSRIGFVQEIAPLPEEETRFFLEQRWSHRVSAHSEDFTDQEAVAAIIRITQGNMRLIDRLMMQVERVLVANQLTVVTKEVVETARKNLIIGFD
jgi:hypothetical protein